MTITPRICWSHITMRVWEGSVEGQDLCVVVRANRRGSSDWSLLYGYSDGEPMEFSHEFTADSDRAALAYAEAWVAANPSPTPELWKSAVEKVIIQRKHLGTHSLTKRTAATIGHRRCGYCGHGLGSHVRRTTRRNTVFGCQDCPSGNGFHSRVCLAVPHK